jgi:flagellar biosynthesis/type III secretory pathway M-ring protein FliF/YscJ
MTTSVAGLLLALIGFIAAFAAARALANWVKRRRASKGEQAALRNQSRQVRRARERRKRP